MVSYNDHKLACGPVQCLHCRYCHIYKKEILKRRRQTTASSVTECELTLRIRVTPPQPPPLHKKLLHRLNIHVLLRLMRMSPFSADQNCIWRKNATFTFNYVECLQNVNFFQKVEFGFRKKSTLCK